VSNNISFGIIGGGPAGLATAICLAEKDFEVTLFERGAFPVDKVCGEGIMPTGVEFLKKHEVLNLISPNDKKEFNGVRYLSNNAKTLEGRFKSGFGVGIRRTVLSEALYKKLTHINNVKIYENRELINIYKNDESVGVEIAEDSNNKKYEFDYLIGCDGIRSKVRKLSRLDSNKYIEHQRIGARMHFEIKPWSDLVEVYWKDYIEAYITPVSSNTVQFAFLWDNKTVRPQSKYRMDVGLKKLFPELFERVEGCKQVSKLKTLGPIAVSSKKLYKNSVILLGDAYSYLDGITGEGISIAFKEAECLAGSISNHQDDFIKYYEKEVKRITKNYLRMTNMALLMSYYPILRKISFPFITGKFFSHLLEVNMGRERLFGKSKNNKVM
jgi:2-polyprenyl-6-methoxyphenol hydroxylase-like FAD-dependent oxidoreductase